MRKRKRLRRQAAVAARKNSAQSAACNVQGQEKTEECFTQRRGDAKEEANVGFEDQKAEQLEAPSSGSVPSSLCGFAPLRETSLPSRLNNANKLIFEIYQMRIKAIQKAVNLAPEKAKLTGPDMHVLRAVRTMAKVRGGIEFYDEVIVAILSICVQAIKGRIEAKPDYRLSGADIQAMTHLHRVLTEMIKRESDAAGEAEQREDAHAKAGVRGQHERMDSLAESLARSGVEDEKPALTSNSVDQGGETFEGKDSEVNIAGDSSLVAPVAGHHASDSAKSASLVGVLVGVSA